MSQDQPAALLRDQPGAVELAAAVVSMAKGAGMTVIVEAIENNTHASTTRETGYRFGQGYHFHQPEPLADAIARLQPSPAPESSG